MVQNGSERSRGPSTQEWNKHKCAIEKLYMTDKKTLKDVMREMADKGFEPSMQQYKTKFTEWGFSKYRRNGAGQSGHQSIRGGSNVPQQASDVPNPPVAVLGDPNQYQEGFGLHLGGTRLAQISEGDNFDFETINGGSIDPAMFNIELPYNTVPAFQLESLIGTKVRQPIHQAAQSGYLDMVKLLLESDATCAGIAGTDGVTPIWVAAQQGHLEVVKYLIGFFEGRLVDVNAPVNDSFRKPIHQAAQGGHVEIVKLLLDHGAGPDVIDNDNITPLWSAAQQGHDEVVEILIKQNANIEIASRDGNRRPIHQAAQNGHVEVVKKLLQAGAMVDPQNDDYSDETPSPLWLAAQQGHEEVAKLLIQKGADVDYTIHPSKRRPLHQAAQNGHTEVVRLLILEKANVNAGEKDGWPPLMIAAQENYTEISKLLLDNNASVNAEEQDGATALWIASQQGHAELVRMLLENGAKPIATRSSLRKPIHQAAQNGHLEAVKLLLKEYPRDVCVEDEKGSTPLLLASQGEKPEHLALATYLIQNGAPVVVT
ncbi:ankyrin unc44 [Fusarium sp. NRRL 52700]|nr:ankyrin unc44 [Fusarium sp. NRRL 52700]